MSIQFGKCNFDGRPVDPEDLKPVLPLLAPYAPDGQNHVCHDNLAILYGAFHTTKESLREQQPCKLRSGATLVWDGRLDNRDELIRQLNGRVSNSSTDLEIVTAAYAHWELAFFSRLIGSWALSVWDPDTSALTLAKDFLGARHLYYCVDDSQAMWCTLLDPLLQLTRRRLTVDQEYIAGWLSFFPAPHLTPYEGIYSVPPASFVLLRNGAQRIRKYWDFDPGKRIRYRRDRDYEEHFRIAFSESVRRCLRSDRPVISELSGGMDSSSIVRIADQLLGQGTAETPRVETLSYYDDSEPNWNERAFFTLVEERRRRRGCHIDISSQNLFAFNPEDSAHMVAPGSNPLAPEIRAQLAGWMERHNGRVLLTGTGGDETCGGVPTALPELEDLLAAGQFRLLARQLRAWALNKRRPWFHLFFEALEQFFPFTRLRVPVYLRPAPWIRPGLIKRNPAAFLGYENRLKLRPLPSFQENIRALNVLRRQLACEISSSSPVYEKRYPYLDRDFLEFVYAIPREQMVRPGQRRSLMRRALAGIVPDEILNRKRKAYIVRAPVAALAAEWPRLSAMCEQMVSESCGFIDQNAFIQTMRRAMSGQEVSVVMVARTLYLEFWLRQLSRCGLLTRAETRTCSRMALAS